jgi:LPS-assembly protein
VRPVVAAALACLAGVALAQPAAQPDEAPLRLRATPMLAEKLPPGQPSAIFVSGDEITGRADLETTVQGHAELRRPGLAVGRHARLRPGHGRGDGHRPRAGQPKGDRYTAREGQLQVDAFEGFLLQPTYRLLVNDAHGDAARIDFQDRDRATLTEANYTTCVRPGPTGCPTGSCAPTS